ncbi:MAG: efflux RND transporter periplasmic adaptor subunit [Terriglobales bacterium]
MGRLLRWVITLAIILAVIWGGWLLMRELNAASTGSIPTAVIQRGQVRLQVFAQGTLKGGNADLMVGPSIASGQLTISNIAPAGSLVHKGDVVVAFDTTTEHYNLTQAEEALQQAQQEVRYAETSTASQIAADAYALKQARYNIQVDKLNVEKNPIIDKIDAETNNLQLASDEAKLKQLEGDIASQQASSQATIAVQLAAEKKAEANAAVARADIASMTLRAAHSGYVAVELNQGFGFSFAGQAAQPFEIGDTVRHGQTVAEIPDTSSWEVVLEVNELDAGNLQQGQPVLLNFVALPGRTFRGEVAALGTATGPVWDRQVECDVKVLDAKPDLRPGLTANAVVTTDVLDHVLHAPTQAVFSQGGQQIVFVRKNGEFARVPVTVVNRSASQAVLEGVQAGEVVALVNPTIRTIGGGGGSAGAQHASGPSGPHAGQRHGRGHFSGGRGQFGGRPGASGGFGGRPGGGARPGGGGGRPGGGGGRGR